MVKTTLGICTHDWLAAGNVGSPTVEFIRAWRVANPVYGRAKLNSKFTPGSSVPSCGDTALDQASRLFLARHPGWQGPPAGEEFEELLNGIRAANEELERLTAPTTSQS